MHNFQVVAGPWSGLPAYVHLKGLAIVRLKCWMNAWSFCFNCPFDAKDPRRITFLTRMPNQISIWFIQEACLGV